MKLNLNKLNKRLKGYHRHFRGRFNLLKVLTAEEYVLWDISFSIAADWDKDHESYGTFSFTYADISYFAQCDPSTVSRRSKKLFELGLWKKLDDGSVQVCGFNVLENLTVLTKELGIIDLQSYIANQQENHVKKNTQPEEIHDAFSKENTPPSPQSHADLHEANTKEPLVSFNGESNVLIKKVIIKGNVRSNDEYQKMYAESNHEGLTPDDMKAIDESISETMLVTAENEKQIVEAYFNGDWGKYRSNVFVTNKTQYDNQK